MRALPALLAASALLTAACSGDLRDGITEIGRVSLVATDTEADSNCRVIQPDTLTPGASDLAWLTLERRVQVCTADELGGDVGGWDRGWGAR